MSHSIWQVLQSGQKYAAIWPHHAVVAAMTETRVVPAVKFAAHWMPGAAVVNFLVQWQWLGKALCRKQWSAHYFCCHCRYKVGSGWGGVL